MVGNEAVVPRRLCKIGIKPSFASHTSSDQTWKWGKSRDEAAWVGTSASF